MFFVVSFVTLLAAVADVLAAVAGIPTVAGVPGIADAVLLLRPCCFWSSWQNWRLC